MIFIPLVFFPLVVLPVFPSFPPTRHHVPHPSSYFCYMIRFQGVCSCLVFLLGFSGFGFPFSSLPFPFSFSEHFPFLIPSLLLLSTCLGRTREWTFTGAGWPGLSLFALCCSCLSGSGGLIRWEISSVNFACVCA